MPEWKEHFASARLGDAGGYRQDAAKKMGTHHQFVLGCRANGWGGGSALCSFESGNYQADPLLRLSFREGRDYGKRYRSCAYRDRYGDQQPERQPKSYSDGAFWLS